MPHLRLLGGAVIEDDAGVVGGPAARRHPLALLALLTTAPSRTLSRGKLVGFLWPESPEKTARNRLNTCIHQLRRELGEQILVSIGADLRLDDDVLTCDVFRFEEALERGEKEIAVSIYGGPFLDGFRLGASPAFEKRVDRERARLRRAYHGALETLAEEAEERGAPELAAGWWRQRTEEDPYDSRITRRLMESLDAAGNRAAALRAGRLHARLLEEEIGTGPSAEVAELVRRLKQTGAGAGPGTAATEAEASTRSSDLDPRAIAVLPFEELGGTGEAAVFAAGLHNDLLTRLSSVAALTVISRTSVMDYRDAEASIREIARELGVGTVVEGGVQQGAGRIRLNVQLIDARRDVHRWAETYDREFAPENAFAIQSELTEKIAETLRTELTPREKKRVGRRPTENLDAYHLYVQGRTYLEQRTEQGMRRAFDVFQRAIRRDAGYALAWSGLADALGLLEFYGYARPDGAPDPVRAARRAVELNPELGEAHASLGILHSVRHEGPPALRELTRALELAPGYAEVHTWLGWVHLLLGSPEKALVPGKRAAELDPLAPAVRVYLAEILLANGEGREALREARRAREIQPEYGLTHFMEGLVLLHHDRLAEAGSRLAKALSRARPRNPSLSEVRGVLAVTRAASGDRAGARELLSRIERSPEPFSTGLVHAALGEEDQAFAAFERVSGWGSFANEHLRYFFPDVLGPLREDPRYRRLLHAVDRSWGRETGG